VGAVSCLQQAPRPAGGAPAGPNPGWYGITENKNNELSVPKQSQYASIGTDETTDYDSDTMREEVQTAPISKGAAALERLVPMITIVDCTLYSLNSEKLAQGPFA